MSQFALLVLLVVLPIMLLSDGTSPIESQPELLRIVGLGLVLMAGSLVAFHRSLSAAN